MSQDACYRLRQMAEKAQAMGRPERAFDLCVMSAVDAPSIRERRYALTLLRVILGELPVSARTPTREMQRKTLGLVWPQVKQALGEVGFPTVRGHRSAENDDCIVRARVEWLADSGPDDLPLNMDETLCATVKAALSAARREGTPCALRLRFVGPTDWTGSSAGLAVALAALSVLRGAPVGDGWVASATVAEDGRVGQVGEMAAKIRLLDEARPLARCLVAAGDEGSVPACVGVASLADAASLVWPSESLDVDGLLEQVRALVRKGRWADAARCAHRLVGHRELRESETVLVLGTLLSYANHCANTQQQDIWNHSLVASLPACGSPEVVEPLCFLAVCMMDAFRIPVAARWAEQAAAASGTDARKRIHAHGTLAKVRRIEGRFGEAVTLQEGILRCAEAEVPEEAPRCAGDLSSLLVAENRHEEALQVALRALELCRQTERGKAYVESSLPFLQVHRARAYAACGDVTLAMQVLEDLPLEAPFAARLSAMLSYAEWANDSDSVTRWLAANHPGEMSPVVRALVARTYGRLGDLVAQETLVNLLGGGLSFEEAARRLPY